MKGLKMNEKDKNLTVEGKEKKETEDKKIKGSKSSNKGKRGGKGYNDRDEAGRKRRIGNKRYDNDINWYTQTSTLLNPVTKIAMIPLHGSEVSIAVEKPMVEKQEVINVNVPGIGVTYYAPIIPVAAKSNKFDFGEDVFSTAGKTLFAQLRQNLNGVRPYNTPDILSYIIIVGTISSYMEHLRRLYNMTFYTTPLSKYTRQNLTDTAGNEGDYDYFVKQGPLFVSRFNALALKLRNLLIPMGLPIVSRWKWLNTYMFADANVLKPQLIIPVPTGFYSLKYGKIDAKHPYTVDYINTKDFGVEASLGALETAVDEILQNDIISVINADLIRVFGNLNIVHTPMILDNFEFVFNPVYSEEFLAQWEHYTPVAKEPVKYHIILNDKTSEFEIKLQLSDEAQRPYGYSHLLSNALLLTDNPELTSEEVIIKTRMMTLHWTDHNKVHHYTFGSEIWNETKIKQIGRYTARFDTNVFDMRKSHLHDLIDKQDSVEKLDQLIPVYFMDLIRDYAKLTVFSHHPIVYLLDSETRGGDGLVDTGTVLGRVNNYGVIEFNTHKYIQNAILTSLVGLSDKTGVQSVMAAKKNNKVKDN